MVTIINEKDRNVLSEGRGFGMGFAFLEKEKGKRLTFKTVQPISPCKDYLNDVVWVEHTGNPMTAYGLSYHKHGIFKERKAYVAVSICPLKNFGAYPALEQHTENLKNNYRNLSKFLNLIEDRLSLSKTVITPDKDGKIYLVAFDKKWVSATYLISMYSLLLRIGQWYNGEQDVYDYIDKFNFFSEDIYLLTDVKDKMFRLIDNKTLPKQNLSLLTAGINVHNCGIKNYQL